MGKTFPEGKEAVVSDGGNVYGSYVHGLFDSAAVAECMIQKLANDKGICIGQGSLQDYADYKQKQYDLLAETLRQYLDREAVYGMLREAHIS